MYITFLKYDLCLTHLYMLTPCYVSSEEAVWTILEACESIRTKQHTHQQQRSNPIPTANNNNTDNTINTYTTSNTNNSTNSNTNSNSISNKEALEDERRVYFEELKTPLAHHDK